MAVALCFLPLWHCVNTPPRRPGCLTQANISSNSVVNNVLRQLYNSSSEISANPQSAAAVFFYVRCFPSIVPCIVNELLLTQNFQHSLKFSWKKSITVDNKEVHTNYNMENSKKDSRQEFFVSMKDATEEEIHPKEKEAKESSPKKTLTLDEEMEKKSMTKNVIMICIAFCFLFGSLSNLTKLQSSINKSAGNVGLSAIYISLVLSCSFLPSWLISKLKAKTAITICMIGYLPYFAAQLHPELYTLIPAAMIMGLAAGPAWAAQGTYFTNMAKCMAALTGEDSQVILSRFFGMFFLFFRLTGASVNMLSSVVFSRGIEDKVIDETALLSCGANFCPTATHDSDISQGNSTTNSNLERPPATQIYMMVGIGLSCGVLSSLIMWFFVDPISKFGGDTTASTKPRKSNLQLIVNTFNQMRHPYQILIIPLTMWTGIAQGFFGSDITLAYVTCAVGIHMVGYVVVCFGVCDAFASALFSRLISIVGRVPIFTLGGGINLAVVLYLQYLQPHPNEAYIFFIIAGLWGLCDAVWHAQVNTMYGNIFPKEAEAAFSNYRLWQALGYVTTYVCSGFLCINVKIYVIMAFLILGMIGYYIIEIMERRGGPKKDVNGHVIPVDKLLCSKQ